VLLNKAPSDFVTANRTVLSEGDRVIPLTGIFRRERFPDPAEQAKLQALSDAIHEAAGFDDTDHAALAYTTAPKGIPAADLDEGQREMLRSLLGTYLDRVPPEISPIAATTTTRRWTPSMSPGRARPRPARRTTTGCRARNCSSSGTTPSAGPTTPTPSGATRQPISGSTC
jgi:hypothetical protein